MGENRVYMEVFVCSACAVYVLRVRCMYLHTCWQSKAWKDSHRNIKSHQAGFWGLEVF